MSASFAGLEGCVITSVNLLAVLLGADLGGRVNSILFGSFSVGTAIAPAIVRRVGLKPAMVASMSIYTVYMLPFIWARPVGLYIAAAFGGLAGSVLWTAQGVYFTRNALAYAAAKNPGSGPEGDSKAISAFAGIFAVVFQATVSIAKISISVVFPDERSLLFVTFAVVCSLCTAAMCTVYPLAVHRAVGTGTGPGYCSTSTAATDMGEASSAPTDARAPAVPVNRGAATMSSPPDGLHRADDPRARCTGDATLLAMLVDSRMLLVMLYNFAYGEHAELHANMHADMHAEVLRWPRPSARVAISLDLPQASLREKRRCLARHVALTCGAVAIRAPAGFSTAFFPHHVTLLAERSFAREGDGSSDRAAAVSWLYALAGLTSAIIAGLFALISSHVVCGRSAALVAGTLAFSVPCVLLLRTDTSAGLTSGALLALFLCYGCGTAAWQGSCMALVGDIFKHNEDEHRAAFAHLKLTSAAATSSGFILFSRQTLQQSAAVTLGANAVGLVAIVALFMCEARRAVVATPIVRKFHAFDSRAAGVQVEQEMT